MRRVVSLAGIGCLVLAGSAEPPAVKPATLPPPFVRPADPEKAARWEAFRNHPDPVLRGLVRGEINAGDPVEPLIARNRHYDVLRSDRFVILETDPMTLHRTILVAENGKLVRAVTASCTFCDTIFDTAGPAALADAGTGLERARQARSDFRAGAPAIVGAAAGLLVWPRPCPPAKRD